MSLERKMRTEIERREFPALDSFPLETTVHGITHFVLFFEFQSRQARRSIVRHENPLVGCGEQRGKTREDLARHLVICKTTDYIRLSVWLCHRMCLYLRPTGSGVAFRQDILRTHAPVPPPARRLRFSHSCELQNRHLSKLNQSSCSSA